MSGSSFKEILNRYINKQANEQETRMVEAWFSLIAEEEIPVQLGDQEMDHIYNRIKSNPRFQQKAVPATTAPQPIIRRIFRPAWTKAAIWTGIVLIAGLLFLLLKRKDQPGQHEIPFTSIVTGKGEVRKIVLPDSSVIWINANTQLAYHPDFTSHREIKLDGEAMFEVTHQSQHPFTVLTPDSVQTKVLGTRFNISSYAQLHDTRIMVLQGRVAVTRNEVKLAILEKQQGIEYHADSNYSLPVNIKDETRIDGWIKGEWEFDSLGIERLNLLLINQYGIAVINKRSELSKIKVSANFNKQQQAEDIVKIFCLLADCSYRWKDKTTIEVF